MVAGRRVQEWGGPVDSSGVEASPLEPRAVLADLCLDDARPIELDPGVNVLVTGSVDARVAREIVDACRSATVQWSDNGPDAVPVVTQGIARITRSEIELRAARIERARAHRSNTRDRRPSDQREPRLRERVEQIDEQIEELQPDLAETRERLRRESDLRDQIAVACDMVEFAMLDDAETDLDEDDDAYERLADEWDAFVQTRAASTSHNRDTIAAARRAVDAASARFAMSGAIGTIDAAAMDAIQQTHQRHQEASQLLETARRNQRPERTRALEEAAAAERAALQAAGLNSYSDFLMLRVRPVPSEETGTDSGSDVIAARQALADVTKMARTALAEYEVQEIDLRARAATLLGRLPGDDVGADLRGTRDQEAAAPPAETPTAIVDLAALCRRADLDTGTDPVATAREWLRQPSSYERNVARIEAELSDLQHARELAVDEIESMHEPEPAPVEDAETVAGAIRGLLSRGALVPNATRSVDIDPAVIAGLRGAVAAIDRDERGAVPLLVEYPWAGDPDGIVRRMLSVFHETARARQVIVIAASRYQRPVPDVKWIDVEVPIEAVPVAVPATDVDSESESGSGSGSDSDSDVEAADTGDEVDGDTGAEPAPRRRWAGSLG
ncbi:MAG TPA: hypothetical protein VGI86_00605 [Acidimicrobiia bacterium]